MEIPFSVFAVSSVILCLVSDLLMCGGDFSAAVSSIPFIATMYFLDIWRRKNKPDPLTLSIFSSLPSFIFFVFYFFSAVFSGSPDLLYFALSLPLYFILSVSVFSLMLFGADLLDIKEPERMVF